MKKEVSTKKLVKTIIVCAVFAVLLAGLIYLMVSDQTYGENDSLKIGEASFGERLLIGLQVAVLGLATVFVMLLILIIAVNLIRLILIGVAKLGEKKSKASAPAPTVTVAEKVCEDDEIVAVITSAIMAYYEADAEEDCKSNLKFRVRSIKEI